MGIAIAALVIALIALGLVLGLLVGLCKLLMWPIMLPCCTIGPFWGLLLIFLLILVI